MFALLLALLVQPALRATGPAAGRWVTSTEPSKDDAKTITVSLRANAAISSWPSQGFVATLAIRCKAHAVDVFITPGMPAVVEDAGRQGTVKMWLDQEPPIGAVLRGATDGAMLAFADGKDFVYVILRHQRLLFRFTPVNSAPRETSFDLRGLDVALKPLAQACQWDFRGEAERKFAREEKTAKEEAERMALLVDKLRSPDAGDRAVAAGMIGKSGPAALSAVPALVVALREDRDGTVRVRAAGALRGLGPIARSALATLRETAMTDESEVVRNEARQAIAAIEAKPEP